MVMFEVAFLQTKIMRYPVIGFLHALVFWGFIVILIGSIEMIIDGLFGTERVLDFLGYFYSVITALGDIFAFIIALIIIVFLLRRLFHVVKRFTGVEMLKKSKLDANIALFIIFLLMISLLGMNTFYILIEPNHYAGYYPVSMYFAQLFPSLAESQIHLWHEINWWVHILWIFIFANILPYSKHFHVFMSVPNVFLSRLEPLGHLPNMDNVTKEVKIMMDPDQAFATPEEEPGEAERFGVLDIEDVTWKNYFDSLACTECGRCTAACPAAMTGKKLSPRKVMIDLRARMKEKGTGIFRDKDGDAGNHGQMLYSTETGTNWKRGPWYHYVNGEYIYCNVAARVGIGTPSPYQELDVRGNVVVNGKIGIGTTSPNVKLDVRGRIQAESGVQVGSTTVLATLATVGTIRYRDDGDKSYIEAVMHTDNGYEWVVIKQIDY